MVTDSLVPCDPSASHPAAESPEHAQPGEAQSSQTMPAGADAHAAHPVSIAADPLHSALPATDVPSTPPGHSVTVVADSSPVNPSPAAHLITSVSDSPTEPSTAEASVASTSMNNAFHQDLTTAEASVASTSMNNDFERDLTTAMPSAFSPNGVSMGLDVLMPSLMVSNSYLSASSVQLTWLGHRQ